MSTCSKCGALHATTSHTCHPITLSGEQFDAVYQTGELSGATKERAWVVTWLRAAWQDYGRMALNYPADTEDYRRLADLGVEMKRRADAIEAGEHDPDRVRNRSVCDHCDALAAARKEDEER